MIGRFHEAGVAAGPAPFVRDSERLTKDRAKSLVASGLQRAVARHGIDRVRLAGGCSGRCIQKALAHDTLPGIETLANVLDEEPTTLDELLAAKGLRLVPLHSDPAADLALLAGLCETATEIGRALEDGVRIHTETLRIADKARPLMPRLMAIIREADALRAGA